MTRLANSRTAPGCSFFSCTVEAPALGNGPLPFARAALAHATWPVQPARYVLDTEALAEVVAHTREMSSAIATLMVAGIFVLSWAIDRMAGRVNAEAQ